MSDPVPPPHPSAPATKRDLAQHEQHEDVTLAKLLGQLLGRAFKKEALLLGGVLVLGALGWAGATAWGQGKLDAGVAEQLAPVKAETQALKTELLGVKGDLAQVKADVAEGKLRAVRTETMLQVFIENVRPGLSLPPPVPVAKDAGP